jgi:hypothetical protein
LLKLDVAQAGDQGSYGCTGLAQALDGRALIGLSVVEGFLRIACIEQLRMPCGHWLAGRNGFDAPSDADVRFGYVVGDDANCAKLAFVGGSAAPLIGAGMLQECKQFVVDRGELPRESIRPAHALFTS